MANGGTVVLPQQNKFAPLAAFFQNLNIAREKKSERKGFAQDVSGLQQFLLQQQQSQDASQQLAIARSLSPEQRQGQPGINFPAAPQFPQAQSQQGGQLFGNLLLQQQQQQGALGLQAARPVTGFRIEKQLIDDPKSPTKFSVVQRNQTGQVIGTRTATPKEVREGVVADVQTGLSAKDKSTIAISQSEAFNSRKIVKDFRDIESQERNIRIALKKSLNDATVSLGPSDQVLITALNKITDPGSVVRESEFARTPKGVALLNRLSAAITKVFRGGVGIANEDRKAIADIANEIFVGMKQSFNTVFDEFDTRAGKLGLDKDVVFGGIKRFDISEEPEEPQDGQQSITATNPQTGQRIQSFDGGKTWQPIR
ncbi:hypothetical protein LCGC14_0600540 [marine sediment metagenome]|uniref:Uncharacterized protein n=1 Tax=marine sediment metagenome TaxID=412755 RepID=A0A0F9UJ52_9ZZZZ